MVLEEKDIHRISRTLNALKQNEFLAFFFPTAEEARTFVCDSIPSGIRVGIGGSQTVREIGLVPVLKDKGVQVLDHWDETLSLEQVLEIRKRQLTCDVFLSSVNAVTEKGELVSRDGIGNRVCAMTFGPDKVFLIAGVQKIVEDLHAAFVRIREIAAPLRAKSLNIDVPCTQGFGCIDCSEANRICRATMILHRRPSLTDITVVLIGEALGY
jgi:L-lactate utilization protein LutB